MWRFPYSSEEILRAAEDLARSFLPEWRLNTHMPDIGSVIAMIFAGQMEYVTQEYSQIPRLCIEELIRMLGMSPNPSAPALAVLVMEVDSACKDGIRIAKGSRFYGNAEETDVPIVFRTRHDLLAVHAVLSCALGISEAQKKIVSYLENGGNMEIPLFGFSGRNLFQEELVLEDSLLKGGSLILKRPFEDKELYLEDVRIKAWGKNIAPMFLYDGEQELSTEGAAIFGHEIFPYKECYIGQDEVLSKAGARIICTFELEWGRFDSGWHREEKKELKPIMKKAPKAGKEEAPHIFPQEITFKYYNGTGLKKLYCEEGAGILTKVSSGRKQGGFCFICPEDIMPMTVGGYESRCIRLQVQRADNCYTANAVHYYPILKNVTFSYTYGRRGVPPKSVMVHQGSLRRELPNRITDGRECKIFSDFPYKDENMLFGFDKVWGEGPVSFYLELENQGHAEAAEIIYEYSTPDGFKPLYVTDGTSGLLRSGIIRFILPGDAGMLSIEGRRCFWIRIREHTKTEPFTEQDSKQKRVVLKGMKLNAVEAENQYVSEEKEFLLEKAEPGLSVKLSGNHILDASVWVNEISALSDSEKEELLKERQQDVQAEYDLRGNATEFYVRWKESENLKRQEGDGRYYMLDRKEGTLKFGDGRHTKIPGETKGIAWKVRVTSCDGCKGNVKKEAITEPALSYAFLNRVYNPAGAYGGRDGENDGELVERGRNFLSTGHKIVSEADFIREVQGFSNQIGEAVLLKDKSAVYRLVVLLKEPEKGGFSQLKEALRVYLEKRFPMAFLGHAVRIEEPIFVQISVNVWITAEPGHTYGAAEALRMKIDSYLSGRPQRIGDMPRIKELEQVIYQDCEGVRILYFQAVLAYTDDAGSHEAALEDVRLLPEAVFMNGSHRVHTLYMP